MFFVPRRQIWTQQPQGELTLDKRNPLASTITHCLPLNGSVREIVNGGQLSLASTGAFDVSQIGRSLQGSGAACASIPINLSGYTKLTVSFLMYWDAFATDDKLAIEYGSNFATNSGFLIDPNSSSGGFEVGVASPSLYNSWKCTRPSAAAWHHYYITLNRTTGTAQSSTIAIDGVIQAMTANSSSGNVTDNFGNNSLYLFSRNNASLFGLGRMANLIIRGGYVGTVSEAKQEFENPWQIFKRPDSRIFVPVSAGGTTTSLIVQDATHAHVADGVTLTTQWMLTVAEALHGHAADNITLGVTGTANLAIADATSGHTSDTVALTLNSLLAVFDAIHAHAADNLTLDTSNATALTVQDSTHAHGADSLGLSLDTWLAIVEAAHGHTADAPTLSTALALQIAESLHAHYADVVVLGFPIAPGSCPTADSIAAAVWAHATRVITGPTPNDNADALLARNWP